MIRIRHLALAAALAGSSLAAQDAKAEQKPPQKPQTQESEARRSDAQKPAPAQAQETAEQRIAKLKAQIADLEAQLASVRRMQQQGGLAARVRKDLADRTVDVPMMVEAKNKAASGAGAAGDQATADQAELFAGPVEVPTEPRKARVMSADEVQGVPEGTFCTIDGAVVLESDLDAHVKYLRSFDERSEEIVLRRRALADLLQARAVAAAYGKETVAARERIAAAEQRLKEEKEPFAQLAKELSEGPSKSNGGDLGYFTRDGMVPLFAQVAFQQKVGEISDVVQTQFGYHLVMTTGRKPGEAPAQDKVKASHILAVFDADQNKLRQTIAQVANRLRQGLADLAFASEEGLETAPPVFRGQ